jgi:hypothetical protein
MVASSVVASPVAPPVMLLIFHLILYNVSENPACDSSQYSVPSELVSDEGARCPARQRAG